MAGTAIAAAVLAGLSACTAAVSGHGAAVQGAAAGPATPVPATPLPAGPSGGATGSPSRGAVSEPHVSPIAFTDCTDVLKLGRIKFPPGRRAKISLGCGTVDVPLDYHDPNGTTIRLQLIKVHDSDDTRPTGELLVNPGGPGGDGLNLAIGLATEVSDRLLKHFDLIGFDPRGVGLSSPIRCMSDADKDRMNSASPDVLTPSGFAAAKAQAASFVRACESRYGSALAEYDTVNTARDMDLIRQAVGDKQMNYLGFSYGTELGAQYAHLFPGTIRSFVLDGAVDPLTGPITTFANQLNGFERAFDQFADHCVTTAPCKSLGDPRQVVYSINDQVLKSPMPTGSSRPLTSNLALTGVLDALYSRSQWPRLASALIAAQHNDGSGLLALADDYNERLSGGQYTNIADANLTISCNDSPPGPSDATIRATAQRWAKQFPMFGAWAAPSLFSCQHWQPDRTIPPKPTAATDKTVLVIGNVHDPATPYPGALDLARTMGNAEVLTWDGEGHTSYLQGSSCINNDVDNYLISGTLPPQHTTCPP
jgi:pimeloyl-ACP methyl ester carboxylesterase